MLKWITVESTAIVAIGYLNQTLYIHFKETNKKYKYFHVPHTIFIDFLKAYSKGRYFNKVIVNNYEYEEME